jgi:very-short-patch-repair endonuclease
MKKSKYFAVANSRLIRKCINFIKKQDPIFREMNKKHKDIAVIFGEKIGVQINDLKHLIELIEAKTIDTSLYFEKSAPKSKQAKPKVSTSNNISKFPIKKDGLLLNCVDEVTYKNRLNAKASKGELDIIRYLENKQILYLKEHAISDLRNDLGNLLYFDFYLPDHRIAIEFDGAQHFTKYGKYFLKNDFIKNEYCQNNGIYLIRIKYTQMAAIKYILDSEI